MSNFEPISYLQIMEDTIDAFDWSKCNDNIRLESARKSIKYCKYMISVSYKLNLTSKLVLYMARISGSF